MFVSRIARAYGSISNRIATSAVSSTTPGPLRGPVRVRNRDVQTASSTRNNATASPAMPQEGNSDASSRPLVYFVTGNQNKLREVVSILEESCRSGDELPCDVRAIDVDLPELQGEPEDIAAFKALAAARHVAGKLEQGTRASAVIVEDTSLCFDALGGLPGPYVKSFLGAVGAEGLPKMISGFRDGGGGARGEGRGGSFDGAYAQCVFAFARVDEGKNDGSSSPAPPPARVFVGRTRGTIAPSPRGPRTFGWDCIFVPDDENEGKLTYAEMTSDAKNAISHRRRALDKLRAFLVEDFGKE